MREFHPDFQDILATLVACHGYKHTVLNTVTNSNFGDDYGD